MSPSPGYALAELVNTVRELLGQHPELDLHEPIQDAKRDLARRLALAIYRVRHRHGLVLETRVDARILPGGVRVRVLNKLTYRTQLSFHSDDERERFMSGLKVTKDQWRYEHEHT